VLIGQEEGESGASEVASHVSDDPYTATTSKSDTSASDGDFVTAEVMFSEVRPETGHFEVLPSDSDEQTSSESGTPVPHRVRLVRDDMQEGGATASSSRARSGSRSPMNVVEVCNVKSSEASQWRKEAMEGMYIQCESKKSPLRTCGIFSQNGWEFFNEILCAYYAFLSTLDYEFLFSYLQF